MYKIVSFWQKKQKIGLDYSIELDEKKCETYTSLLVDKFVQNEAAVDFYTSNEPSKRLTREERMHILPIISKYCKDPAITDQIQESLIDDLKYCRVQHEKVSELSKLIYFIERSVNCKSVVLPELKEIFLQECNGNGIRFEGMRDKAFRMFTWVYLSAF